MGLSTAKYPASTIQILGAEKALFRAMRTKHNTPKYGLIYQASIVGQAHSKIKGKISRTLSAKCSVCIRVDALGESENAEIGVESKNYIDNRLRFLENNLRLQDGGEAAKKGKQKFQQRSGDGDYNTENDFSLGKVPKLSESFVKSGRKNAKGEDQEENFAAQENKLSSKKKVQKKVVQDSDDDSSEWNWYAYMNDFRKLFLYGIATENFANEKKKKERSGRHAA